MSSDELTWVVVGALLVMAGLMLAYILINYAPGGLTIEREEGGRYRITPL